MNLNFVCTPKNILAARSSTLVETRFPQLPRAQDSDK